MVAKKSTSFFQITRSQIIIIMALGAFTGVVLSVVSGYEWAFVEKMREKGLVTLAKIRGIRKEKGIKTEKYY